MIERLQGGVETTKIAADGFGRIDVHRRANPARQFLKVYVLAVENPVSVRKGMH
jgi:hypothetical protein